MKKMLANMVAMVVFCTVVNFIIEVLFSGLSVNQSVTARLAAIPINVLIAVPYGIYRDYLLKLALRFNRSVSAMLVVDVFAYASFLSPVYVCILICDEVPSDKILIATGFNILFSFLCGGLYGRFLEFVRGAFYVETAGDVGVKK